MGLKSPYRQNMVALNQFYGVRVYLNKNKKFHKIINWKKDKNYVIINK